MAKKITILKGITKSQADELLRARKDPFFFSNFIKVIHPVRGKVHFKLYPYQIAVLYEFLANRFNIILKFRQAGITELISMYSLWLAMYHPYKSIVIISIKDKVAKKVLRKIKSMYRNLPDHLKVPIVNGRSGDLGTATEMEFANGSFISSVPTTEEAGRSEALSLLVIDEAAIVRWAETIWAAAFPTLSTGGSAIVNSTPYGVGNWYHKSWVKAISKENDFNPIRLYWTMHPERDQSWYNQQAAALGPRRTAQEIDGDFLTSGHTVFDLADIRAIADEIPYTKILHHRWDGMYREIAPIKKGEIYSLASDVSTGRSSDYSAGTIFDSKGNEVAYWRKKIAPRRLARFLGDIGERWNWAVIGPESNDIGLSTTEKLQDDGYPNLFYSKRYIRRKGESRKKQEDIPGWYTTSKNRSTIITNLEEAIRVSNNGTSEEDPIYTRDPFFVEEAYTFVYTASGRPEALNKGGGNQEDDMMDDTVYTDDSIMGKSIAYEIMKQNRARGIYVPPM